MNKYSFDVILAGHDVATESMADAVYEAGCDDASVSSRDGTVTVGFDRVATNLNSAIASACLQVQSCGYKVDRVEMDQSSLESIMAV